MGSVSRFKRIYIEITSTCNLRCSFCQETKRPPHFMSIEKFGHILDEIKPYTNYIYLHVKGEPLLHPELGTILGICSENGIRVNITTNGTLVRKNLATLMEHPVHQINISMHSADDNSNVDLDEYVRDLIYSCNEINAKTDTEISLRLWNTKTSPTLFGENNCRIRDRLYVNVRSPFEWPDLNSQYENPNGICQGLKTHMAILSDGTVVPCCLDGNGVIGLGNIFRQPLSDILNSERCVNMINSFRNRKACEPLCIHCSYKDRFQIGQDRRMEQ